MSTRSTRHSIIGLTALFALGLGLVGHEAAAINPPSRGRQNLVEAYRLGLQAFMTPAARRQLGAIDVSAGRNADPGPLAYVAADASARWFAAEGLTGLGYHADSARLRGLAPARDRDSANAAIQQVLRIVESIGPGAAATSRAASAVAMLRKAATALDEATLADPSGPPLQAEPPAPPESAPSPAAHALGAVQASTTTAAEAIRNGADRARMSELCLQSLSNMVDAARGQRIAARR